MQSYRYLGSEDLARLHTQRRCVRGPHDILSWITESSQQLENHAVVVTFVIDIENSLWIADRRSEHVACADGGRVLSAGEMTFQVVGNQVEVAEITNQSLGYCPEPESWPAVADALDSASLPHPAGFTTSYIIRRCEMCETKNIVKDGVFECGVCEAPLSAHWNLEPYFP